MAFVVRTQKQRLDKPEGHYITTQSREWLVEEIKITDSGNVVLTCLDPVRLDRQLFNVCTLTQLELLIS